jgi:hypothetical protein
MKSKPNDPPDQITNETGMEERRKPILRPRQQKEARARIAAGVTQRSVARSYKVNQSTISRLGIDNLDKRQLT